jgi:hypothetical protein
MVACTPQVKLREAIPRNEQGKGIDEWRLMSF